VLVGSLSITVAASASVLEAGSVGGAPTSGVFHQNFDSGIVGLPHVTVTLGGSGAAVVTGSSSDAAAPFLSGGNGAGFGSPNQPNGADLTNYITTGTGGVSLQFDQSLGYFGVLWGSVDTYNTIQFWDGGTKVGEFTGGDILAGASGDRGENGTLYVNFTTDGGTVFDRVEFLSSSNAFEFDNIAFGERLPTGAPEPITLSLFGAGLAGLGMSRRRRKA
jgi:hypothetical protein